MDEGNIPNDSIEGDRIMVSLERKRKCRKKGGMGKDDESRETW